MSDYGIELSEIPQLNADNKDLSQPSTPIVCSPIPLHPSIEILNNSISEFLKKLADGTNENSDTSKTGKSLKQLLDAKVSRVITRKIPLYPQGYDITSDVKSMNNTEFKSYLVVKTEGVEYITEENVLNYFAKQKNTDKLYADTISGLLISAIDESENISRAVEIMSEKRLPCLLIRWNSKERKDYKYKKKIQYPRLVTLASIHSLLLQALVEDDIIMREVLEVDKKFRTGLDDLNDEEIEEEDSDDESDDDIVVESEKGAESSPSTDILSKSPNTSNVALQDNKSAPTEKEDQTKSDKLTSKEKEKRRKRISRIRRRCALTISNNFYYILIIWICLLLDVSLSFLYLCDMYDYLKHELALVLTFFLFIDDVFSILGENWNNERGSKHVLIFFIDIQILSLVYIFYFIRFTSNHVERICGSIVIILKCLRSYKLIVNHKNAVANYFRKMLNRSRNRLDGSSLDITLITRRIIAMSWPGSQLNTMWRNNIKDVEEFLNKHYGLNYWVINLCAESDYAKQRVPPFDNRYSRYCIYDHNACSIDQIRFLIDKMQEWLDRDPKNVIAIHCKGGKGRTGMIISCLLLRLNIRTTPEDALNYFAACRTNKEQNKSSIKEQRVRSPSQIRYVYYYNNCMDTYEKEHRRLKVKYVIVNNINGFMPKLYQYTMRFYSITFDPRPVPDKHEQNVLKDLVSLATYCIHREEEDYTMKKERVCEKWELKKEVPLYLSTDNESRISYLEGEDKPFYIEGDTRIELVITNPMSSVIGFVWFNTDFIYEKDTYFNSWDIDFIANTSTYPYFRLIFDNDELADPKDEKKIPVISPDAPVFHQVGPRASLSVQRNNSTPDIYSRTFSTKSAPNSSTDLRQQNNLPAHSDDLKKVNSVTLRVQKRSSTSFMKKRSQSATVDIRKSLDNTMSKEDKLKMQRVKEMYEASCSIFESIKDESTHVEDEIESGNYKDYLTKMNNEDIIKEEEESEEKEEEESEESEESEDEESEESEESEEEESEEKEESEENNIKDQKEIRINKRYSNRYNINDNKQYKNSINNEEEIYRRRSSKSAKRSRGRRSNSIISSDEEPISRRTSKSSTMKMNLRRRTELISDEEDSYVSDKSNASTNNDIVSRKQSNIDSSSDEDLSERKHHHHRHRSSRKSDKRSSHNRIRSSPIRQDPLISPVGASHLEFITGASGERRFAHSEMNLRKKKVVSTPTFSSDENMA